MDGCLFVLLCGAVIGIACAVLAVYLLIRGGAFLLRYFGLIPENAAAIEDSRAKAVAKLKASGGLGKMALFQYIDDARLDGRPEADIAAVLRERGWPDREVGEALSAHKEVCARFPLPQKGPWA